MNAPQHPPPDLPAAPRRRRWPRALTRLLAGLLALLLLALAGAWVWAGSEGSLATALRWAAAAQPLTAEQVSGSLRRGGAAARLTWQQDGLRLQASQAQLRWTPAALLRGTLQIDRLSAARIDIAEQGTPSAAPSAGPPESLALPLKLQIRELAVGELRWANTSVQDVTGQLDYDGARYVLTLDRARFAGGLYRARAALSARAPVSLQLALAGALTATAPGGNAVPLTVQATLQGPLTELRAQADLFADPARSAELDEPPELPGKTPAPDAAQPTARASARITPWAAQPLPEAHIDVAALDLAALWPQAPRTGLTGRLDLTPLPPAGPAGWALKANLANAAPGPWDQGRLPLRDALADLTWADGIATVRALSANLGGGALQASGRWAEQGGWQIDARIDGVNPAQLHTRLAPWPVDGAVKLSGAGAVLDSAVDFDAALQARAQRAAPANALGLRDLQATGRWAAGLLTLQKLRLRASDAELSGQASLRADPPGGSADLTLTAPGLALALKGQAQPASGDGALHARIDDAARLLAWARKLPGANAALAGASVRGQATLQASWRGGWRNPALRARFTAPQLDWRAPGDGGNAPPIQAHQLDLNLSGTLAQARLEASGQFAQGQRQLDLRLAASGGRAGPANAPLARASWHASLESLHASVQEPALGQGIWQLALRAAVPLAWSPQDGGRFEAGAGELTLAAPQAQQITQAQQMTQTPQPATIAWGPAHWQAGQLSSAGRLTGLPLQWLERLSGASLAQAGLSGDVMLEGGWDITLGRQLHVAAHLARASGDLALLAHDAETGVQTRVAAGLHQASLSLSSDGRALTLQLTWDSERAGSVEGALRTELRATPDAQGGTQWDWPPDAPLQGQLRARLPQMAVWSTLAPPGWRLRGSLHADASIGGARASPHLDGTLAADDLALRSVADGVQLAGGRLRARLNGTRLLIDEFALHGVGDAGQSGGALRASGEAGWINSRMQARLHVTLDQLRASIRADRQLTVSGQIQTALDGRQIQADGRLRVERARIELPDESAPALDSDVTVRGAANGAANGPPAGGESPLAVAARVQIDLGDDFRLRGMGIATRLAGTLTLAADGPIGAMPKLTGTVRTVNGSARAYSQQLNISRGNIVFSGDAANPALDIIALRPGNGSDQQVGAQVMGSALLPRVRLYSQPALPDNEALAWLLLGRAAPSTGAESAMLQSAALALLGGRQGRPLAAHFGLDELHFSGASTGSVADASVTLGKRLSERLYAAYERSLSGAGGTLMIFHELSRRWTLRGQTGENSAVDLIFRLAFD